MNNLETQCAMILNAAKSAQLGLAVRTNDAARARATLYRVRKLLGDIELSQLQIRVSPDDTEHELWIINKPNIGPTFDPSTDLE